MPYLGLMSSTTIRTILIMMLLIIGALFITQAYWFKKAFALEEQQFDDQMSIALRSVAHDILVQNEDTTSRIPPIVKLSSNEFLVETKTYFSLEALDKSLRTQFGNRDINIDFDYVILETTQNEIVLGNTIHGEELINQTNPINRAVPVVIDTLIMSDGSVQIACKAREDMGENRNFKIRINNKTAHLLSSMGIWMFSSISLLVLLAVFTFIIVSMVKGNKLAELKKDFVNNMTHELKTPIANIAVASDAIRNKKIQMDGPKLQKYADIIYDENVRLHNLVDRVLQISAIEKNDASLSFEKIDIHAIIKSVTHNFDPLIQARNGVLQLDLKAKHYIVEADKVHLANVISNLIENAIKYSKESPEIRITTANSNDGINLSVSDTGIGINKENQHRIFEKFFRAETGNLHNTKGYGLGLSYVKLIVEKHSGLLTFRSTEHQGSTFNICLPV